MKETVNFIEDGKAVSVSLESPGETLLDYLRLRKNKTGTKEGCCEGDCGACTVVLAQSSEKGIEYVPVNACIYLLGMMEGKEVITVEDISTEEAGLHPVQEAMVQCHGSQCGFCTPGIVMSLFAQYESKDTVDRETINNALSGNLCRCTGYRPIIDAALQADKNRHENQSCGAQNHEALLDHLNSNDSGQEILCGNSDEFFASPSNIDALLDLRAQHPDATLIAGATDVGLWLTKKLANIRKIIWLGRVKELLEIDDQADHLTLGAAVTYEKANDALTSIHPDIGTLLRRLGSKQIRSSGTVGGNIANGSPIGDMPPTLLALGCDITLKSNSAERKMQLEDFFIRYGQQDIANDEVLSHVVIRKLQANDSFYCSKVSKRFDQDISSLLGAVRLTIEDEVITDARIAFGGMAEIPKRAKNAESFLIGTRIDNTEAQLAAVNALADDFQPITDMRASKDYRMSSAKSILQKAFIKFGISEISNTSNFDLENV